VPSIAIHMNVEIEMDYDSFNGRTPQEFAELVHDDVISAIWEMRDDDVKGLYTDVKKVTTYNDGTVTDHDLREIGLTA
jgi:hypothetical protein